MQQLVHTLVVTRRACGHVDVGTCPHQVLAVTLTISQPGVGGRLCLPYTGVQCPHQVLKATSAPVMILQMILPSHDTFVWADGTGISYYFYLLNNLRSTFTEILINYTPIDRNKNHQIIFKWTLWFSKLPEIIAVKLFWFHFHLTLSTRQLIVERFLWYWSFIIFMSNPIKNFDLIFQVFSLDSTATYPRPAILFDAMWLLCMTWQFSYWSFFHQALGSNARQQAEILPEMIEWGPLCITDLFQNKSAAYFNPPKILSKNV